MLIFDHWQKGVIFNGIQYQENAMWLYFDFSPLEFYTYFDIYYYYLLAII